MKIARKNGCIHISDIQTFAHHVNQYRLGSQLCLGLNFLLTREFKSREVAQTKIYAITRSLLKSHFTHNISDP